MTRLLALLLLLPALAFAAEESAAPGVELPVGEVLALGPLPLDAERFGSSAKVDELRRALAMQLTRRGLPVEGAAVEVFGQRLRWQRQVPTEIAADDRFWVWHLGLESERFVQGELSLGGLKQPALWREGVAQKLDKDRAELALPAGSHPLLLLHRGRDGESAVDLRWKGKAARDALRASLDPSRRVSARLLTNAETVGSLAISADGRLAAMAFSGRDDTAAADLRRLELREIESGRVLQTWTGSLPTAMAFSPDGRWLATREGKQLWLRDLRGGAARLLLAEHEHLGAFRWHPDSGSILFSWTKPFEAKDAKVKRLRALEDRWRSFRDEAQLYQVDVASGLVRPLTAESSSVTLLDVHPDGQRLLLSQRLIDYAEPPHSLWRLFELSLADGSQREIAQLRQLNAALFADEGYWLLAGPGLAIGPAAAGVDEATREGGLTPNEFDTQLYRISPDGGTLRSLSIDFDPSIGGIERLPDGDLLLPVSERDRALLYRYQVKRERFVRIETGFDLLESFVTSAGRSPVLLAAGTDVAAPQRVHAVDISRNRFRVLVDSAAGDYAQVRLGEVRDFAFTSTEGDRIDGRYYLPPDFDPSRRYPLIVFYYGGTTPISRQFTGRYPLHLWAAMGYVVYVPQPRGTIGYGQRFSALHVNAWGEHTADDIIEGTRAFAAAHPFVDARRIGNIGASYGGFMTMLLATRTDLYAASVSHAGISSIASYWGQGWWGYGYSGIASRGSFPWNNRELYVERSPLFHADRIRTPLLLLTGDADTNVPPGESHSMYTALKLLGREVELVEVPGEDHWILEREKRYVWWDTMLAWFERWLKDDAAWWQHLYPETAPPAANDAG
jgi:dipeptidyl aminopeptidase/acylaminoacyl peptidase